MNDILFKRTNKILAARFGQIVRNIAALHGGEPYLRMRLWRAPNESDLSWKGGKEPGAVGRLDRACCINDAGRIASKIDQYLFSKPTNRAGIDDEWAKSVTTTHQSINDFWLAVSDALTAGQWCWLQADRAAPKEGGVLRSLADREAIGDAVAWKIWESPSVPDWCFDDAGHLLWLLTAEVTTDNSDPFAEPTDVFTRTLWRRAANGSGGATFQIWKQKSGHENSGPELVAEGSISAPEVPFVLVGTPSVLPWWFDDVEMIMAQLVNLDSLHIENLVRTVFPQLIIPETMLLTLETRLVERAGQADGAKIMEAVREVVRGLDTPLVESAEDRGTTRFIQPSMADLEGLPTEQNRKRQILFDQVGLALFNKETRQVQSAESKKFDHLDTEATLRHRSTILQTAEEKLVDISASIDTAFKVYKPEWPMDFDVTDFAADSAALATLSQIGQPTLTQRKLVQKAVTKLLDSVVEVTDEERARIDSEIDAMKEEEFAPLTSRYGSREAGGSENDGEE